MTTQELPILEAEVLPSLVIQVEGKIITSDFANFAALVRARIESINKDLVTDDDFDQAAKDAKLIKGAEEALTAAKEKAIADSEQLDALFSQIDDLSDELAEARLRLSNQVKKRKEEVKEEVIKQALDKLQCAERHRKPIYGKSLTEEIKGKRTIESMRKALDVVVSIHNGVISYNRDAITKFIAGHGAELVPDAEDLEIKSKDYVEAELRRRFEAKRAAEQKKQLEEEAAKAKAEVAEIKQQAAEAGKPPAKPEEDAPWGRGSAGGLLPRTTEVAAPNPSVTAREEWDQVRATIIAAFGPLKSLKGTMKHASNEAKLQGFGAALNKAWEDWG